VHAGHRGEGEGGQRDLGADDQRTLAPHRSLRIIAGPPCGSGRSARRARTRSRRRRRVRRG
jgi:hypothetical protein